MSAYTERLPVPVSWWLIGEGCCALLATTAIAGEDWLAAAAIYLLLCGGCAAFLLIASRATVRVAAGTVTVGRERLQLPVGGSGPVSEAVPLDERQTRELRGPRADPRGRAVSRPYLRLAVFVPLPAGHPHSYWLVGTRHPAELAAAINAAWLADGVGLASQASARQAAAGQASSDQAEADRASTGQAPASQAGPSQASARRAPAGQAGPAGVG